MASQQNKLIILTAPSGAGKTSITRYLLTTFPRQLGFSISAATRQPREYEKNGVDYYFMAVEEFKNKIQNNEFVEWEMVYEGKYYGTLKSELQRIWNLSRTPLLDIDVQGAIHVQQQFLKLHFPFLSSLLPLKSSGKGSNPEQLKQPNRFVPG